MTDEKVLDPPRRPARAIDVARRAGVSTATVSLIANGKAEGRISLQLQERVQQAITDLGYVVNRSASSLVTGRRSCLALVTRDLTNPVMSLMASAISEVLIGRDIQLMLAVSEPEDAESDIAKVIGFGVDGILLHAPTPEQVAQVPAHTPAVLLDYQPRAKREFARISYKASTGAAELARHLVELGHQRMVYVDFVRRVSTFQRRRQALTSEFSRLAHEPEIKLTRASSSIEDTKAHVMQEWSAWRDSGISVIVAATDVQAYGVLAALADLGVAVPGEVSVAAFDNLPFSSLMTPSLTTVDLPAATLGRMGATVLLDLIEQQPEIAPPTIQVPTELIVRASTGPARHTFGSP
ncbi:LacI family DNA-binding transcriptional regulator [Mycobacterium sp. BMJ-28]